MRSVGDDEENERINNLIKPNPIINFETPTIRDIFERTLLAESRNHIMRSLNDDEEEGEFWHNSTKFGFRVFLKTLIQSFDLSQVWVGFWSVFSNNADTF